MLLTIDIGNTNITFGVFEGERLRATWRMATRVDQMADEYAAILLNLLHLQSLKISDIKEVALCCVVPPLLGTAEELIRRYFHVPPLVVGPGLKTGVHIRVDNPKEVGTDRIVNTAAAHHLYGGPIIIVDVGTATTFDTVSREGDFLGTAIAPGIATAAEALFAKASALPRIELVPPQHAIGTNTVTSMQSGIVFGYVGLVEGIVARIHEELGEKATVVATGGYAGLIAGETSVIDKVNADLTLVGLRLIHEMNKS
ncbi:MAG: type III pantothenate kinase [Dehalococcoidales bacterium]|jgi:type III pantothenate kinase|nr:type III pantothenate kinase [Dehalococcoidales bacterium]MDP7524710.1 type III pantothenate kinase [Dehalococcoidales bacterium]